MTNRNMCARACIQPAGVVTAVMGTWQIDEGVRDADVLQGVPLAVDLLLNGLSAIW